MLFLSTVFRGDELIIRKRKRPNTDQARARPIQRFFGDEAIKTFAIPSIAATYNDEMNHVDRGDQLRASRGYSHSIRRGPWQAIAWTFLLDTALINSYLLQLHGQPKWKKIRSQSDWRGRLIDDLIAAYWTGHSRKRFRAGDENTPMELHERVKRGKNSPCLACQGLRCGQIRSRSKRKPLTGINTNTRKKGPKKTRYGCRQCDVALCNQQDCWDFYHHIK